MICALILVPFYLIWAGKKVKRGEKGEEDKYKKLFDGLITTKTSSLAYNIVFFVRRFIAVLILTLLATHPIF